MAEKRWETLIEQEILPLLERENRSPSETRAAIDRVADALYQRGEDADQRAALEHGLEEALLGKGGLCPKEGLAEFMRAIKEHRKGKARAGRRAEDEARDLMATDGDDSLARLEEKLTRFGGD